MTDHDTPIEHSQSDSTPPIYSSHCHILLHAQNSQASLLSSSSPSIVRNPSPPPIENLSRADMVGDEMYSKSWFCQVLLKLIQVKMQTSFRFFFMPLLDLQFFCVVCCSSTNPR